MSNSKIYLALLTIALINFFAYGLTAPFVSAFLMGNGGFIVLDSHLGEIAEYAIFGTTMTLVLSPTYFLAGPLLGSYSDLMGRKRALVLTQILLFVSLMLMTLGVALETAFLVLVGALLLNTSLILSPMLHAVICDISNGIRRAAYFIIHPLSLIPMILAAQVGSSYLMKNELPELVKISFISISVLLVFILGLYLINKLPETSPQLKAGENHHFLQHLTQGFIAIFSNSQARTAILLLIVNKFALGLYAQQLFYYMVHQFNYSYQQATLFMAYLAPMILCSVTAYVLLLKRISLHKFLLICFVCMALGLIGCSFVKQALLFKLFLVPLVFGSAVALPILWTLLVDNVEPVYYGLAMGIGWPACAIAWTISGIVTEFASYYGNARPFQIASVVVVIGLIICWRLYINKRSLNIEKMGEPG